MDRLSIQLIAPLTTRKPADLEKVLEVVRGEPHFMPTHWSTDERRRQPFDDETVLTKAEDFDPWVYLWRLKAPKYKGEDCGFGYTWKSVQTVRFEFTAGLKPALVHELYEAADRAANVLKVEYGIVHNLFSRGPEGEQYNYGFRPEIKKIFNYGLCGIRARNWFGPTLVKKFGRDLLLSIGGTPTSWGGIRVDLMDRPWEGTFEVLKQRQAEVMQALTPTGLFADYKKAIMKPAPNWTPPPWDLAGKKPA